MDKDVAKRLEAVGFGTAFPKYSTYMPTGEDTTGLIEKMREAMKNTKFKPPVGKGTSRKMYFYGTEKQAKEYKKALKKCLNRGRIRRCWLNFKDRIIKTVRE